MEQRAEGVSAKLKVTLLAEAEKSPGTTGRDNTGHDLDLPRKAQGCSPVSQTGGLCEWTSGREPERKRWTMI